MNIRSKISIFAIPGIQSVREYLCRQLVQTFSEVHINKVPLYTRNLIGQSKLAKFHCRWTPERKADVVLDVTQRGGGGGGSFSVTEAWILGMSHVCFPFPCS